MKMNMKMQLGKHKEMKMQIGDRLKKHLLRSQLLRKVWSDLRKRKRRWKDLRWSERSNSRSFIRRTIRQLKEWCFEEIFEGIVQQPLGEIDGSEKLGNVIFDE
jgi:hypothetical protein